MSLGAPGPGGVTRRCLETEAFSPRPQLPPHLASSPLGLSFPSVMRQWGPSTQAASPHPQESAWKFLGLEVRGKGRGGQEEKKVQVGSPRPGGGLTLSL